MTMTITLDRCLAATVPVLRFDDGEATTIPVPARACLGPDHVSQLAEALRLPIDSARSRVGIRLGGLAHCRGEADAAAAFATISRMLAAESRRLRSMASHDCGETHSISSGADLRLVCDECEHHFTEGTC